MEAKKVLTYNYGTENFYGHAKFGGNRATHVGVRGRSVMFSLLLLFFVHIINAPEITVAGDLVALLDAVCNFFRGLKALSSEGNKFENCR